MTMTMTVERKRKRKRKELFLLKKGNYNLITSMGCVVHGGGDTNALIFPLISNPICLVINIIYLLPNFTHHKY
jgi:fumarate reductase subunit C